MSPSTLHPAKFSDVILEQIDNIVETRGISGTVLDPFAGVGRIHELARLRLRTVGVEIEPIWADLHPDTVQGNALSLPFEDDTFEALATSPSYGNRFADSHNARDGSVRRSYTHDARRQTGNPRYRLHEDNSGLLQWGPRYRSFHKSAWVEATRVTRSGVWFILNISDHVRGGEIQPVTQWHVDVLVALGWVVVENLSVGTPRMRNGANSSARVPHESVIVFRGATV